MELESVKKIYKSYSSVYDVLFKRFFLPRIRHAISSMELESGSRVLDVGVGTGLSLSLYPSHSKVTGIDLSKDMLDKARQKVEDLGLINVELREMDAMALKFPDDSFDAVFISHVVSVVPDPARVMKEVRRVCKDGGRVVIVNHFKSRNKMLAGVQTLLTPISEKIGWRSDLCMDEFLSNSGLRIDKLSTLKKIDFWHMIFATNLKQ